MTPPEQHAIGWHSHHVHGRYAVADPDETPGAIRLRFLCADRRPVQLYITEALLPGAAGVFSVLSEHTPTLSLLTPGAIEVYNSEEERDFFAVSGGFAIIENNTVTILTEAWEHSKDIDIERAKEAHTRATAILKAAKKDDTDIGRAEAALGRATARIQAHGHVSY